METLAALLVGPCEVWVYLPRVITPSSWMPRDRHRHCPTGCQDTGPLAPWLLCSGPLAPPPHLPSHTLWVSSTPVWAAHRGYCLELRASSKSPPLCHLFVSLPSLFQFVSSCLSSPHPHPLSLSVALTHPTAAFADLRGGTKSQRVGGPCPVGHGMLAGGAGWGQTHKENPWSLLWESLRKVVGAVHECGYHAAQRVPRACGGLDRTQLESGSGIHCARSTPRPMSGNIRQKGSGISLVFALP